MNIGPFTFEEFKAQYEKLMKLVSDFVDG